MITTPASSLCSLLILVAEDNLVNQKIATKILEAAGHRVEIADNGRRAVELAAQKNFDLILMDIQMPEMSGEQATEHIRALAHGSSIPIIALTAHSDVGDKERYLSVGMDGYMPKPINRADLFTTIDEVIRRKRLQ